MEDRRRDHGRHELADERCDLRPLHLPPADPRHLLAVIEVPYDIVLSLLATGFLKGQGSQAVQILPPLSWIAVLATVVAVGRYIKDWKLGSHYSAAASSIWSSSASGTARWSRSPPSPSPCRSASSAALLIGLLGYRSAWFEEGDHAGTRSHADRAGLRLSGAGAVPVRLRPGRRHGRDHRSMPCRPWSAVTMLALRQVPPEIVDSATMAGCTRRQMTWKVLIPAAMPTLMVGVNQVIMLSLNMVIIASMIGAGGLGFDVLSSLRGSISAGHGGGSRHRGARHRPRPPEPGHGASRRVARGNARRKPPRAASVYGFCFAVVVADLVTLGFIWGPASELSRRPGP